MRRVRLIQASNNRYAHFILNMDTAKFHFKNRPILESLNSTDITLFNEHLKIRKVAKGVELFKEGSEGKEVFIIKSGKVKIYQTNHNAASQILYIYSTGDMFGYQPLLCNQLNFASAMTIEECDLFIIQKKHFIKIAHRSFDLLTLLLQNSSHEFSVVVNYIGAFALKSGRARVALSLLILEEKYRVDVNSPAFITLSRSDLASFARINFETLSRIITEVKTAGSLKLTTWVT